MSLLAEFVAAFGVWDVARPYIHKVVDGQEMRRKARKNVLFDPDKCWGCGLCANTCPSGAIVMRRLELDAQEKR